MYLWKELFNFALLYLEEQTFFSNSCISSTCKNRDINLKKINGSNAFDIKNNYKFSTLWIDTKTKLNIMKRSICFLFAALSALAISAQTVAQSDTTTEQMVSANEGVKIENKVIENYRRSSLYTVLVEHTDTKYDRDIAQAFMSMPTPDKFNNHDLLVKSFESIAKNKKVNAKKRGTSKDPNIIGTEAFIQQNDIARSLVSKWFNRNPQTGSFDLNLIAERAYYDASAIAIQEADASKAGRKMLLDAGPDLIGKTFMVVNDITFIDKGEQSEKAAKGIAIFGAIAGALLGSDDVLRATTNLAVAVNEIDGFRVNITSYLYRLKWNNDILNSIYESYWIDKSNPDPAKKVAYEQSDIFNMEYIGFTSTQAGITTSKSFEKRSHSEQMFAVCTRALDKSIVELQRAYDDFKVNTPISAVDYDKRLVEAKIGLKEGVNPNYRYEVLMADESKGYRTYKRVGMLKPVAGKIWDNRYGALEEAEMHRAAAAAGERTQSKEADAEGGNAYLSGTTFEIISGAGDIHEGMLIREAIIK